MAKGPRVLQSNDQVAPFHTEWILISHDGNLTADKTYKLCAPFDGFFRSIDDIIFGLGTTGVGGTRIDLDVRNRGSGATATIFDTKPSLTPAAANNENTAKSNEGDTGVVRGALSTDADLDLTFEQGHIIHVLFDEVGTYTTDAADAFVWLGLTHHQDYDPDITEERD